VETTVQEAERRGPGTGLPVDMECTARTDSEPAREAESVPDLFQAAMTAAVKGTRWRHRARRPWLHWCAGAGRMARSCSRAGAADHRLGPLVELEHHRPLLPHKPFFRPRWLNTLFGFYLSLLLGIPSPPGASVHLAHHARRPPRSS